MGAPGAAGIRTEGSVTEDGAVVLRPLRGRQETQLGGELLARVHGTAHPPRSGEYEPRGALDARCLGAFEGDRLLGVTCGVLELDDANPKRVSSQLLRVTHLAVEPDAAGRGLGEQLMVLQREQALGQGLQLVTWAQDPLDARLAHLAVRKLGAVSRWVGSGDADQARGLEVEWWVGSARVQAWLARARPGLELADALEAGAPKLNDGTLGDDGLLRPSGGAHPPDSAVALVEIPFEIALLRSRDLRLAEAWRAQIEEILDQAFALGYWLTDFLWLRGERHPRAYYLLIDGERQLS